MQPPQAAIAEARRALREFERLGAAHCAAAAAALLRELGASGRAWPKAYREDTWDPDDLSTKTSRPWSPLS